MYRPHHRPPVEEHRTSLVQSTFAMSSALTSQVPAGCREGHIDLGGWGTGSSAPASWAAGYRRGSRKADQAVADILLQ